MAKAVKKHGRVYTPNYIVKIILDFGGYSTPNILQKHVIDNSCGDGAFLVEIVDRYCSEFIKQRADLETLKKHLETYIHGIELDTVESKLCVQNLCKVAEKYGVTDLTWDIQNTDTLTVDHFNGKIDYVFGNPPYVRVHNLDSSYEAVKKYRFAEGGMTDLFIVFFEIGFNMLAKDGLMCLITPSSWLSSLAGKNLRKYTQMHHNLSGVIDLEHFQAFEATTYTLISRFSKSKKNNTIEYYTFNEHTTDKQFQDELSYTDITIGNNFYFSKKESLALLKNIKTTHSYKYVSVKNGFATLADKIFIGEFDFAEGTIDILKASNGKWSKCVYPYDKNGKPLALNEFANNKQAFDYLSSHKVELSKDRDIEDDQYWYLFGRTQAIKDVCKTKYAINIIVRDVTSIKLEVVKPGQGIYSGLYILTDIEFETIEQLIHSEDFINYIKLLKNYKSGGYYTFASKDLEQYLNYKLTEKYGQSRISNGSRELF
ncbi:MAG: N-6 DNA methylase [Salinivirgaceae bacterium]|nr:N-6 DNA methylase [Salinivirgaceae bacterium]MBO7595311.1 N-6 DNA methylase [Salinivirgaceae bacterium]